MEDSSQNKTNDLYDQSFLDNKIFNNSNKEKSCNLSKNNNCILLCPEIKTRIKSLIDVIDSNIKDWEKDIKTYFNNAKNKITIIKEYINYSFDNEPQTLNKTTKNDINKIKNGLQNSFEQNKDIDEDDKNNKSNKSCFNFSYKENNESMTLNFKEIDEIIENLKNFNLNDINTKYNNNFNDNVDDLRNLIDLNEKKDFSSSITKLDKSFSLNKTPLVPKAESFFGLDNQFEIIKYDLENHLLVHINNNNDLILKLINKENKIVQTFIKEKIFENDIREIRYFSKNYDDKNYQYLLVSSKKNELKVYEIKINSEIFEDTLKEINHIKDIYKSEKINQDLFDLSSCVIRFNKERDFSEIYTTCWEGNSIKIYYLYTNTCIKEIISKTSCNINFCNIINEQYLIFCGCNKQDNYTCANCIDLSKLDYDIKKDENVPFIKFQDKCEENKENVFFNFIIYKNYDNEIRHLIICDEKGFIRIFNFNNRSLIQKISISNDEIKKKDLRLNSILLFDNNMLLITQRNTGNVYMIKINDEENKNILSIEKRFNLFDTKIISLRKYEKEKEYFLALGKNKNDLIEESKIILFTIE